MEMLVNLNLRLFDADTQVTTQASLSDEMKTYYEKRLLDNAEPALVHDQLAQKRPIPKNGGKTIEFRRYSALPKALNKLVEGYTPAGRSLEVSSITATVDQYGDYVKLSDMLEMTAIDRNVEEATKILGAQAGRTLDTVTREIIIGGSNKMILPKVASDGTETAVTLRSGITTASRLTPKQIKIAAAKLKRENATPINGSFVAIIHPDIACDLQNETEWIEAHKYAAPENLFSGEIGRIGGVRFVETTEAKIIGPADMLGIPGYNRTTLSAAVVSSADLLPADVFSVATAAEVNARITAGAEYKLYVDELEVTVASVTGGAVGTCKITLTAAVTEAQGDPVCGIGGGTDGTAVYCTVIVGENAYATTEVEGMGLQHIIKQLGYGDDALNQRSATGWKATKTAVRLAEEHMIRLEHSSPTFGSSSVSN